MIPISVILAAIIGFILRSMMRSKNETVSLIGGISMGGMFVIGIICLIVYNMNK